MRLSYRLAVALLCCFGMQHSSHSGAVDNVAAGERLYVQCTGCHAPGYHRTGPKHCNILGRRAGTATAFSYTPAMQQANVIWDKASLDQFLISPLDMIPGNSMGFAGITSARERLQLIAFLATLTSDHPLCR